MHCNIQEEIYFIITYGSCCRSWLLQCCLLQRLLKVEVQIIVHSGLANHCSTAGLIDVLIHDTLKAEDWS